MSVTTHAEVAAVLEARMRENWHELAPIKWANVEPFTQPQPQGFVAFHIIEGASVKKALGRHPGSTRHTGLVVVQIFIPAQSNEARSRELADVIDAIFRDQILEGILCRTPSVSRPGKTEEGGGYWQRNVSVPFQWDY